MIVRKIASLAVLLAVFTIFCCCAQADEWYEKESGYYTLVDETGRELTIMARQIFVEDEYISTDNKHYSITKVDDKNKKATARYLGKVKLPVFEKVEDSVSTVADAKGPGNILIYCTHSDESYIPSDGSHSIPGKGGVFDVAEAFKNALQKRGISAILDKTPHDPHDAGAYRRSRITALRLIKRNMPVAAVFDIHRDAVPKKAYQLRLNEKDMARIRIVVGRRNQNRQANEQLAYKIKAIADKVYPGLIKDIYIGRGMYNQELSPRSLIFECGSYENTKEEVVASVDCLADVVSKAIAGGIITAKDYQTNKQVKYRVRPVNQERRTGAGTGIIWLMVAVIGGVLIFIFISMGGREMIAKVADFARGEFGDLMGKRRRK